jgi:hypothetical protein
MYTMLDATRANTYISPNAVVTRMCAAAPALLSLDLEHGSVCRREAVSIHILQQSAPLAIEQRDTASDKQPAPTHNLRNTQGGWAGQALA